MINIIIVIVLIIVLIRHWNPTCTHWHPNWEKSTEGWLCLDSPCLRLTQGIIIVMIKINFVIINILTLLKIFLPPAASLSSMQVSSVLISKIEHRDDPNDPDNQSNNRDNPNHPDNHWDNCQFFQQLLNARAATRGKCWKWQRCWKQWWASLSWSWFFFWHFLMILHCSLWWQPPVCRTGGDQNKQQQQWVGN